MRKAVTAARTSAALLYIATASLFTTPAAALSESEALSQAQDALSVVAGREKELERAWKSPRATPEQRLAGAEIYLVQKNYERAIDILHQVVELAAQGQVGAATHADALFMLGEAYFHDGQLLTALHRYEQLVGLGDRDPYSAYLGRAVGRAVDVALRTDRPDAIPALLSRLDTLQGPDKTGIRAYARAKAHYAVGALGDAEAAVRAVPKLASLYPQAQYLLGVLYLRGAMAEPPVAPDAKQAATVPDSAKHLARPILQFQYVTRLKPDSEEQRQVVELSWLALARIFYETGNALDAVDAYRHVPEDSKEFPTALSELGWAYIALEDYEEAQRALEVLSVVAPEELEFAEGELLRADLMLRAQQYEDALYAYRKVRREFAPVQEQIEEFLRAHDEPELYYERLLDSRLGVSSDQPLPPLLLDWLGQEQEDPVFALIDDISRSRRLVTESEDMVARMNAVLDSPARTGAMPELRAKLMLTVGLQNRIARGRHALALAYDELAAPNAEGAALRAQRAPLMSRFEWLPLTRRDFAERDGAARKEWLSLSQQLQRVELETDKLRAIANGLERVLREAHRFGVSNRPGLQGRIEQELVRTHKELADYRARVDALRKAIDLGRLQVGFGDVRTASDERVKHEFSQAFGREFELAASGVAGPQARAFAEAAASVWQRLQAADTRLAQRRAALEREIESGVGALRVKVAAEAAQMTSQKEGLERVESSSRRWIGEAAKDGFAVVGKRLRSIVMRADIGIAQQAWEVRARHLERLQTLQRARAREERALDGELREVLEQEATQ